jgi:hypothetical protein
MKVKIFIILFFNILIYSLILLNFDNENYQLYSVVAQVITLLLLYSVCSLNKSENEKTKKNPILGKDTSFLIAFLLITLNAVIGIFNIIYTVDLINFNQEEINVNVKNLVIYTSSATIIFSQIGGFFIQLFLIYFLSVIIDLEVRIKEVFLILGTAYFGFFLISVASLIINMFTLDSFNSIEEFTQVMDSSILRIILGKFGEYLTLNIAIYLLVKYKNFPLFKSTLLIYLPNILLLASMLLFKKMF